MRKQIILLAIALFGCASSQAPEPLQKPDRIIATDETTGATIRSRTELGPAAVELRATQDSVMKAVDLTYLFLKVPITHYDKALGELGNKMFVMWRTFDGRSISNYLNCGDDAFRGPNADYNRVTASLVTRIHQVSTDKTLVETTFSGYISKPGSSGAIYCTTTGTLETHMAEMVASRVPHR
jgi:hypothetical protein